VAEFVRPAGFSGLVAHVIVNARANQDEADGVVHEA
jgi:hypothetical protein